ncbi:MAG TPA: hypothetical protein VH393_15280 [Ktedonobacterales bacterium]|jgi:hypothetical protein
MRSVGAGLRQFFSRKTNQAKKDLVDAQVDAQAAVGQENLVLPDLNAVLKRQKHALYPEVLSVAPGQEAGLLYFKRRVGSGLIATALRHSSLTEPQIRALNEFRLDQYTLCGFYDLQYLRDHRIERDPDLLELPPDTIHIVVGANNGRILAYSYMQPPKGTPAGIAMRANGPRMSDVDRPWFPCEEESFGPDIFPSLPALRDISVARIAEISILLRNQLEHGPASIYAVGESILAMALIQGSLSTNLAATIAYIAHEARKIIYELGMPALYAPFVPVTRNLLPPHWSPDANGPGRFWPTVFLTADVRRGEPHLNNVDAILDLPTSDLRRALIELRRSGNRISPSAAMPEPGTCPIVWTEAPELAND